MNGSLLLSFGMPFALKSAMRPMSLYESGDSTGEVSLKDLFDGVKDIDGASELGIDRLAFVPRLPFVPLIPLSVFVIFVSSRMH